MLILVLSANIKQKTKGAKMVFGLSDDNKADSKKKGSTAKKSSNADEAAAMLKKMEAKKAAGDCPFC